MMPSPPPPLLSRLHLWRRRRKRRRGALANGERDSTVFCKNTSRFQTFWTKGERFRNFDEFWIICSAFFLLDDKWDWKCFICLLFPCGELKGVSPSPSSSSNFGPVTNRNHSTLFPFFSSGLHCAILTGVKTAGDRRRRYIKKAKLSLFVHSRFLHSISPVENRKNIQTLP